MWVVNMKVSEKDIDVVVTNIYNEHGENFTTLLAQGIKRIDINNLQMQIAIEQKESKPDA